MKIYIYMKTFSKAVAMVSLAGACIFLTGCSDIKTIERDDSAQVIQKEFTQTAVALTNELDNYYEIDEFFVEDETSNTLEQQIRQFLVQDEEVLSHKLKIDTMDLKLFADENQRFYFLAVMKDQKDNPNTLFGIVEKDKSSNFTVIGEQLAAYFVNLPKTYLLSDGSQWALVSQRPFSTFEECYFFKLNNTELELYMRGWQDPSLNYYGQMADLLNRGLIDEAIALPDESMYPMGYEEPLFETANLMVKVAEEKAIEKEKKGDIEGAIQYLDWSLNYYFENHYGMDLVSLLQDNFSALKDASKDDFGYRYTLPEEDLEPILKHYANLIAKQGLEKEAMGYEEAITKYFKHK